MSFKYNKQRSFPFVPSTGNEQNSFPVQLKFGKRLLNPPVRNIVDISNCNLF